jgi:hypothetical protein
MALSRSAKLAHDNTGTATQVKHQSINGSGAQLKNMDGCASNIIL